MKFRGDEKFLQQFQKSAELYVSMLWVIFKTSLLFLHAEIVICNVLGLISAHTAKWKLKAFFFFFFFNQVFKGFL